MAKPHRNDISIGKDRWITFAELDGRQGKAQVISIQCSNRSRRFFIYWKRSVLQAAAVLMRIGLWPEDIARAKRDCQDPDIIQKVTTARDQVAQCAGSILVSHKLNNYFDRQVLLTLLDHFKTCLLS